MTERTCLPPAVIDCIGVTVLASWCELCGDFRHFRAGRTWESEAGVTSMSARVRRMVRGAAGRASHSRRVPAGTRPSCTPQAFSVWTARLFRTVDGDGSKSNAAPTALPRIG